MDQRPGLSQPELAQARWQEPAAWNRRGRVETGPYRAAMLLRWTDFITPSTLQLAPLVEL